MNQRPNDYDEVDTLTEPSVGRGSHPVTELGYKLCRGLSTPLGPCWSIYAGRTSTCGLVASVGLRGNLESEHVTMEDELK